MARPARGVGAGLATVFSGLEGRVGRLPLLLGSGLAIGLLAWIAGLAGANPLDVLFSGQASITPLLQATGGTLVALALAKALAYVVSPGWRAGLPSLPGSCPPGPRRPSPGRASGRACVPRGCAYGLQGALPAR